MIKASGPDCSRSEGETLNVQVLEVGMTHISKTMYIILYNNIMFIIQRQHLSFLVMQLNVLYRVEQEKVQMIDKE